MPWIVQVAHADKTAGDDAVVTLMLESDYDTFVGTLDATRAATPLPPHPSPYETLTSNCAPAGGNGRFAMGTPLGPQGTLYILVVNCEGHSPVFQRLRVGPAETPQYAGRSDQGADANLRSWLVEVKAAGTAVNTWTIHVSLARQSEVVMIAGNDESAAAYTTIAMARRWDLAAIDRIDRGTPVTIYSCEPGRPAYHATWVRAATKAVVWMRTHFAAHANMSFTVLYHHLNETGGRTGKNHRVREVSIFTHAWRVGPILVNTGEGTFRRQVPRHPADRDARTKDFSEPNRAHWPHIVDALADGCTWHIWGCAEYSRITRLAASVNVEHNRRNHLEMYLVNPPQAPGVPGDFEEWTSISDIRRLIGQELTDACYAARCAQFFGGVAGLRVIAPAPGSWTQPTGSRFEVAPDVAYQVIRTYLAREYPANLQVTTGIDGDRYINYAAFRGIPLNPARTSSAAHYYHHTFDGRGATIGFYGWRMPYHENFPGTVGGPLARSAVGFNPTQGRITIRGETGSLDADQYSFPVIGTPIVLWYVVALPPGETEVRAWRMTDAGTWVRVPDPLYLPEQTRP
ncbi:MAG: hypothetical protein JW751_24745 [Polyangiaceae bacterium]|nr:hypothetical protein [Polyangiaceae bacterium]